LAWHCKLENCFSLEVVCPAKVHFYTASLVSKVTVMRGGGTLKRCDLVRGNWVMGSLKGVMPALRAALRVV
jgi:hypothetical protein